MACEIERPDPTELFTRMRTQFSNMVLGGAAVIPESNEWYVTALHAAMFEQMYAINNQAIDQLDPRTACCDNLVDMAALDGIYPRPATYAQGYILVQGDANAPLPNPLDFEVDGVQYQTATTETQPSALDANGEATIRVRALTAGPTGNVTSQTATLTTTVANVNTEAKVCGDNFCGGLEAETCEEFRTRYLNRKAYQPRATDAYVQDKLLEWPCATRAIRRSGSCCCVSEINQKTGCGECGCGEIGYYLMFDGTFDCGLAPASVVAEVSEWMFGSPQGYGLGQMEVGVCGKIYEARAAKVDINIAFGECLNVTSEQEIQAAIEEYFSTIGPSQTVENAAIERIVAGFVDTNVSFEVNMTLTNTEQGYGPRAVREGQTDDSAVYMSHCGLEPDCDYMLCLNSVTFSQ